MVRRGSFNYKIDKWSGGMDSYHAREDVPEGVSVVLRNLYADDESLTLRNGCTAIPQGTHIGAAATAGVKGLYIWTPDEGNRHILAAYPKSASSKVGIYAIHTTGATALGGDFATSPRISFAGFGQRCYISDGRSRLFYTDGVYTAPHAEIDRPMAAFHTSVGVPYADRLAVWDEYAFPYTLYTSVAHFPAFFGGPRHLYYGGGSLGTAVWGTTLWRSNTASVGVYSKYGLRCYAFGGSSPDNQDCLYIQASASLLKRGAYVTYAYTSGQSGLVTSGQGTNPNRPTAGHWDNLGAVSFWAKSDTAGHYMDLCMGPDSSVPLRMPIRFDTTHRWEYFAVDFSPFPASQRAWVASARLVAVVTGMSFSFKCGPLHKEGLQRGVYEYAPAFHRTSDQAESPMGEFASVRTGEQTTDPHGVKLPARSTKDTTVDRVFWYRRGGASTEWRKVADVPVGLKGWDGYPDQDVGILSPDVPDPAPRFNHIARFGETRMMGLGGYDRGDYAAPIPTCSNPQSTSVWTAMSIVNAEGLSRGVEIFGYTAGSTNAKGSLKIKLQKKVSGTFTTQRYASVALSSVPNRRWTSVLWTNTAAGNDSYVTLGSGLWKLVYSAVPTPTGYSGWYLGSWKKGKPSYYHLLDYPGRVWVSRAGHPTYFDRLTTLDAADLDGFWLDLPGASQESITGHGYHGSDHLIFTANQTFHLRGSAATDFSCVRVHSSVGCAAREAVAECDNWTLWVSGQQGRLRVYSFGSHMDVVIADAQQDVDGFTRIGLAIEPILNLILDPTHMSAGFVDGRYELFFGETVTYKGNTYNSASFDLAKRSWVCHQASSVRVKAPRFVAKDGKSGGLILASPASSTAGTSANKLWWWNYPGIKKDGASAIGYVVEPRHVKLVGASESKLRGYEYRTDQATAGRLTINAYQDGVTAGTLLHNMTGAGGKTLRLTGRFIAQGNNVGLRAAGTATTSIVIRSIDMYLDRKR